MGKAQQCLSIDSRYANTTMYSKRDLLTFALSGSYKQKILQMFLLI
jgi:hypothetical protein